MSVELLEGDLIVRRLLERANATRPSRKDDVAKLEALADDIAAGRIPEIRPTDVEPLHRDTALVALNEAMLERTALHDFAQEIAVECARVGTVIENRLLPPKPANAA